jgi:anti-sigma factor RsiW
MNHLGQQLSALIDGELDGDERDRVLWHLVRCGWCQDEAAALRTLKRRMTALGEEAAAGAGLTGRLIGLSLGGGSLACPDQGGVWPQAPAALQFTPRSSRPEAKSARYLLAGSFAVFLAGLGTAAFIAGGDPQIASPAPQVTPSVGVYTMEHDDMNGLYWNELRQPMTAQPGQGISGRAQNRSSRLP